MLQVTFHHVQYILSNPWNLALVILVIYSVGRSLPNKVADSHIPYAAWYQGFVPRWISNTHWIFDSEGIIERGRRQLSASIRKAIRSDANVILLTPSAAAEVANLPFEIASRPAAIVHDLLGKWTGLQLIAESGLNPILCQRKLTPNLSLVTPSVEDEVNLSVEEGFANVSNDWTAVKPYYVLRKVSARVSSRVMVGIPEHKSSEWLDVVMNFTEEIFKSIVIMRCFPPWLYPILGFLLPTVWRTKAYVKKAHQILGPEFEKRLNDLDQGTYKPKKGEPPNGFDWLTELAQGDDRDPARLAHSEILLHMASIHTTLQREINVLYDLIAQPSLIDTVREEITEVIKEGWSKASYAKLQKLDSIICESQRMGPPALISVRRVMQKPHTLSDGTLLPRGAYVCAPSYAIENDPAVTEDPESFDGLRNYRKRQEAPGSQGYQFTTPSKTSLTMGYGNSACPGRFFAALTLKVICVKLFTEYDFKFVDGRSRPKNMFVHDFVFLNPEDTVLVRKRPGAKAPF